MSIQMVPVFGVYRGRKEQIMLSALPGIAVSASLATQIGRRHTHMQRTEDFYSSANSSVFNWFANDELRERRFKVFSTISTH
jgi:hypothetical protein